MKVKLDTRVMADTHYREIPKDIVLAYRQAMFDQREMPDTTIMYRTEEKLFHCIRQGEPDKVEESLREILEADKMMGCMSKDPLRQAQYAFISGLTLATRSAIEGGMPEIEAYNLSDVYAQKADVSKKIEEIMQLFAVAYYDFAKRVQLVRKRKAYSYPITLCITYILDHLHYQISLTELARVCNRTPQYLSALFRKETNITITEYIMNEKLETAKQMLTYSEHTLQEIASFLGFCSHSSFTAHFGKSYGITPREYRNNSRIFHPERNETISQ
ncbi:MAG: Transcriptional regulator, AraC [Herbinix sp.]|jgi:YesN/AraC family two-component response regulator|nr:Transcriptional regulator, AraC [Herbinix sp.]